MSTHHHHASARPAHAGDPGPCHIDHKAEQTAARLLNGAGKITVVCHDGTCGYTLETALHGAAADGRRYMVVAPQHNQWPAMECGRPIQVAMTIAADTPLVEICMNTAELTGHAILTRCSTAEELELVSKEPRLALSQLLAHWPHAQLWHIEPLRMTVHHGHGSYVLDHQALQPRPAWPTPAQELDAVEAMRNEWGPYLTEILPCLKSAATVTAAFPDAPGSAHCATGRAYPVAITDSDVWFLIAEGAQRHTLSIPLEQGTQSVESLMQQLRTIAVRDH